LKPTASVQKLKIAALLGLLRLSLTGGDAASQIPVQKTEVERPPREWRLTSPDSPKFKEN
jgi:hypothetical protein